MLDFMRRNANSWVMIFLFGIIIFVFAINFGPWAGNNMSSGVPYAATVNNQVVSLSEFRTAYSSQFARIKQFRPDYSEEEAEKDGLKKMVLDQLVARELLTQMGKEKDLRIGPKLLAEEVKARVFGPEEGFNKEEYKRRVNGFFQATLAQFEEQVEKELIADNMANLLGTAIFISDDEAKRSYIDENTKISLEFVKVNPEHFEITRKISKKEIDEYKPKHIKEISEYYSSNISNYMKEKQVRASHILVKLTSKGKESNRDEQLKLAQNLLARVKGGEDFAKVAREDSADLSSKIKGGDLGFFTAAMMVDEFSTAAFALKVGEVSEVVESPFGFHIIKVTGEKGEQKRTQDQASDEIAEILIKQNLQNRRAKATANRALAQLKVGVSLNKLAIKDLVTKTTTSTKPLTAPLADQTTTFNKNSNYIAKIGNPDKIRETVFSLTMKKKTPSKVLKLDDSYFAIRLKSRNEADLKEFDEQKETIKSRLAFPRRRAFMQQYLSQLQSAAKISYNQELIKSKSANI